MIVPLLLQWISVFNYPTLIGKLDRKDKLKNIKYVSRYDSTTKAYKLKYVGNSFDKQQEFNFFFFINYLWERNNKYIINR
jgi:hypothetical protein